MGVLLVVGVLVGLSYYLINLHTNNQDCACNGCGCGQGGHDGQGGHGGHDGGYDMQSVLTY